MKYFAKLFLLILLPLLLTQTACTEKKSSDKTDQSNAKKDHSWVKKTKGDYTYRYVKNDPSKARFYKLDNGLTVILSPSKKKPRIQTYIATKAGSKTDPADHTGLAHYLEHMLFKGTDKYGSLDWEKEKPLLDSIQGLYEDYNSTDDEKKREAIYKNIDAVSGDAAKYAIANEYDKMMSGMGAKGTNAFTSFEKTVYTEDIPGNAIDKYLAVQAERFRHPVFRLFHTELEAVYEEKNRSLDSDGSKVFEMMFKKLFPNSYGRQTTIGTIHDLKNPSLVEIRKYFNTYYVPNNMGVIMAGDFDPDKMIKKVDDAFGSMTKKEVPEYKFDPEKKLTQPVKTEVYGPEPERIMLGFRFPKASSEDAQMLSLVGEMLTNGSAGLIDLDLVKKQKLLGAYAFPYTLKDYSSLLLQGNPTEDQSLDDVRDLLLQEIDSLKNGRFSDDLITSIINNEKKDVLETNEDYNQRAGELMNNFTLGTDWLTQVDYVNWLGQVTKQDIVDFANKYFDNNYVAIYKRQGEDKDVVKVEKPDITPVEVNRNDQSDFLTKIADMPENKIDPVWLDYNKDIERASTGDYKVLGVQNKDNGLFEMDYYFDTGSWASKLLPIAGGYLNYIGTKDKSSEEISQEFYKLASSFRMGISSRNAYITLEGLQENFEETVRKFDDLLENCTPDQDALDSYIKRLKKNRKNAKENKRQIMSGLRNYAMYGPDNPFNNELSDEELDNLTAQELVDLLHKVADYKHKIIYYGPQSAKTVAKTLKKTHKAPEKFIEVPKDKDFKQQSQDKNTVLLAHYDMVQAEIFWIRNNEQYNEDLVPQISFFNQYFGGGMNSIVFQTIRESKALAYSTYAYFSNPSYKDKRTTFRAYVGTQSDKFDEAIDGMNDLLTHLPESKKAVKNAKESIRKKMATQRITGQSIIYNYLHAKKMGRDFDIRKTIYNKVPDMSFKDLNKFYKSQISDKPHTYCIVSGEGKLDQDKLHKIGEVKQLSLEEIFGY